MRKLALVTLGGSMLLMGSCVAPRKMVYVEDMVPYATYLAAQQPKLRIQKSDRISIVVSSKNPELTVPFNQDAGAWQVEPDGNVSSGEMPSSIQGKGYLVDSRGTILFPVLGEMHVEGFTLEQISDSIRDRLQQLRLVDDPIVKMDLLNMKITMLGEVAHVGVLSVPDNRITLLDAIARAGGLTSNAESDRIAVIREERGVRRMYINDVGSSDVFKSPTWSLQQNDIVYAYPRSAQKTLGEDRSWRYYTTGLGVLSVIATVLLWLK